MTTTLAAGAPRRQLQGHAQQLLSEAGAGLTLFTLFCPLRRRLRGAWSDTCPGFSITSLAGVCRYGQTPVVRQLHAIGHECMLPYVCLNRDPSL